MKSKVILIVFLCLSNLLSSQSFEGYLNYSTNIKSLGDSIVNGINKRNIILNLKKTGSLQCDTVTYIISKKGDYAITSIYEGINIVNTYKRKDNLIYQFYGNSTVVNAIISNIDLEEKHGYPPTIKVSKDSVIIGDFRCSVVEIFWKTGVYRYYFNSDILKVDPDIFKGHDYDQWYKYMLISKSLPLRIEKEVYNLYKVTYNLESYQDQGIDYSIFNLPKLKEVKELSKMYENKKVFFAK